MLYLSLYELDKATLARFRHTRTIIKETRKVDIARYAKQVLIDYGIGDVAQYFKVSHFENPTEEMEIDIRRYQRLCGTHFISALPHIPLSVRDDELQNFMLLMVSDLTYEEEELED